MAEKIKAEVDRLLLVFDNENKFVDTLPVKSLSSPVV